MKAAQVATQYQVSNAVSWCFVVRSNVPFAARHGLLFRFASTNEKSPRAFAPPPPSRLQPPVTCISYCRPPIAYTFRTPLQNSLWPFQAPLPSAEQLAVDNIVFLLARCEQSYPGQRALGQPWAQLKQQLSRMDEQQRAGARAAAAKLIYGSPPRVGVRVAPSYTLPGLACAMVCVAHNSLLPVACTPTSPARTSAPLSL